MTTRTVAVELIAKVQGLVAGVKTGSKALGDFGGELQKLGKDHKQKFNEMALATAGAGAAMLGVFGAISRAGAVFDKQMSEVSSVMSKDVAGGLGKMREAALQAGKDTAYSATEAAKAEAELAKAGIKTADILGGALTGALSLAAAGQLDLSEAAEISAKAMNVFKLEGKDVPHIADVLAASANKSATDVHDMGEALKMGGLAAHNAGLSIEETAGVLSAFADSALVGSDAGTSLKTMLSFLSGPTGKAKAEMKALGIEVYDASGNFIGAAKLAGVLHTALAGLTVQERQAALQTIFGSDATRAATVLYEQGEQGIQGYIDSVNDVGAAQRSAAEKTDNLAGDVERLQGSMETLTIKSSGANKGLRLLVQGADAALGKFMALPSWLQTTATVATGLGGATLLLGAGFVKAKQTTSDLMSTLAGMGPMGERAAAGLGKAGSAIAKYGAYAAGVGIAFIALDQLGKWIASFSDPTVRDVDKLSHSISDFASNAQVSGELAKTFGTNLQGLGKDIGEYAKYQDALAKTTAQIRKAVETGDKGGLQGGGAEVARIGSMAKQSREDVAALDKSLAAMVNSGGASQAKLSFEALARGANLSDEQIKKLRTQLPEYNKAANGAADANKGLAKGFGTAETNAAVLKGTLEEAVKDGTKLIDVWMQLNGAFMGTDKAMLSANEALTALKQAFLDNGSAIEGNSDKALKNRIAVEDAAHAAAQAAQAKYEETGSTAAASAVYEDYIRQLRAVLNQSNLTKEQVDELIRKYAQMPPSVYTDVKVTGGAHGDLSQIQWDMDHLPGYKEIVIRTVNNRINRYEQDTEGRRWGGITQHAATGLLSSAGMFSGGPTRYAFAEPSTGGEAFIPRKGNYGRSMQILNGAASWYGARVTPNIAGQGGGGEFVGQVNLYMGAEKIYEGLLRFKRRSGKTSLAL